MPVFVEVATSEININKTFLIIHPDLNYPVQLFNTGGNHRTPKSLRPVICLLIFPRGHASLRGGCEAVRRALCTAALSAIRHDQDMPNKKPNWL